jgi:hypothetical protein
MKRIENGAGQGKLLRADAGDKSGLEVQSSVKFARSHLFCRVCFAVSNIFPARIGES